MPEEFEKIVSSVAEKERFRVAANKLLNQCFLLKKQEQTRKEYIYVRENRALFEEYFDLLGYTVRVNEDQGVIALCSDYGTGRLALSKYESIFLLILRLLYLEKRREITSSYEEVVVLMEEIREKYALLKVKVKPVMGKDMEKNMVKLFRRYNIVSNIDTDITKGDTRIIIYPSVLMAVTTEDINEFYEMTEKNLQRYAGGEEADEADDAGDEPIEEET
ncbi:MAG: DUF4194 domain-containing protein [Lachnospiraceae bacterium]|nr:DUF4194 domain-containing protein [Lachnospiraceae bacterium]